MYRYWKRYSWLNCHSYSNEWRCMGHTVQWPRETLSYSRTHWCTGHGANRPTPRRNSILPQNTLVHDVPCMIYGRSVFLSVETHRVQVPSDQQDLSRNKVIRWQWIPRLGRDSCLRITREHELGSKMKKKWLHIWQKRRSRLQNGFNLSSVHVQGKRSIKSDAFESKNNLRMNGN